MTRVIVEVSIDALPELMRRAVKSVPRAQLIEVSPEGALVGRRTNFALGFDTTRFTFHSRAGGGSEVRAESTNAGVFALFPKRGVVLDTGRAVRDAIAQIATIDHD